MTQWATFAGVAGVVVLLILVLSRRTERSLSPADGSGESGPRRDEAVGQRGDPTAAPDRSALDGVDADGESVAPDSRPADQAPDPASESVDPGPGLDPDARPAGVRVEDVEGIRVEPPTGPGGRRKPTGDAAARVDGHPVTTGALLANVAVTQGLFAAVVLGAAVYAGIPADALGIAFDAAYVRAGLVLGTGLGLALYVANEVAAALAARFGVDHDESLRGLLAPDSAPGWTGLLLAVLPTVALFEEVLFRAALVGAVSVGFDVSPWLLAVVSSVAFALGHGIQGEAGIVVTGLLGLVLAAAFVLTWNLLLVVVAHYLVNALEFVVHEGLGIDWADAAVGADETKT